MKSTKLCPNCGNVVKRTNKFCNSSCAASFNNTRRTRTEESKQKTAKTIRDKGIKPPSSGLGSNHNRYKTGKYTSTTKHCPMCNVVFTGKRKFCGDPCKHNAASIRVSAWLRTNRSHIRGRSQPSYMEMSFEAWLQTLGMIEGLRGYLKEVHFFNKETGKHGWIDFLFPSHKLIVELDGSHHKDRVELDAIRDRHLADRGWRVFRITQPQYQKKTRVAELLLILGMEAPSGIEPELGE